MPTGYVWEEIYGWHNTGNSAGAAPAGLNAQPYEHFESADSKIRLASAIEVSGLSKKLKRIPAIQASVEDISLVHPKEYIDRIKRDSATPVGGDAGDGLSPFGTGSYEIALWAAGGAIAATKAVVSGEVTNAYALIRPPGHHARVETRMGFCIFANAAIAIRYAQKHLGVKRVAVLDWDVHHGNGTQSIFYADPNVLTISMHQDGLFPPDSGHVAEQGEGAGKSTLLQTIMGFIKPNAGAISFEGKDITSGSTYTRTRLGIGYVPQDRPVFSELSVRENLLIGASRLSKKERTDLTPVLDIFPKLADRLDQKAGTMSGGERKMVGIARALIGQPKLLVMDEPTEGVWHGVVDEIQERLIAYGKNNAILIVEQNLDFTIGMASQILLLERGVISQRVAATNKGELETLRKRLTV